MNCPVCNQDKELATIDGKLTCGDCAVKSVNVPPSWEREEEMLKSGGFLRLHEEEPCDAYWKLAKVLVAKHNIKTVMESEPRPVVYYFNGGSYVEPAEGLVRKSAKSIAGKYLSSKGFNETFFHLKGMCYVKENDFDTDTNLIVVENGVLNISTKSTTPHTPELLCRVKLPVSYDAEATCPRWLQFLEEVIVQRGKLKTEENEKVLATLQEYVGYCLHRRNEFEKALMLTGAGRNGKSVFLGTLTNLLGKENVSSIPLQKLDKGEYSLAAMVGKLANIHADLSDRAMVETGNFKLITSGDDVYINRKYLNAITTTIYAKQLYSTNKVPESEDLTPAFFRRWIIVNFPNTFDGTDDDKQLDIKLDAELPGILNWALAGLERLKTQQHFSYEVGAEEAEMKYLMLSSPVAAFVEMCLEKDSGGKILKDVLYGAFVTFAKNNNMPILADNAFARKLKEYAPGIRDGRVSQDGHQVHAWLGYDAKKEGETSQVSQVISLIVAGKTYIPSKGNIVNSTAILTTLLALGADVVPVKTEDIAKGIKCSPEEATTLLTSLSHDGAVAEWKPGMWVLNKHEISA